MDFNDINQRIERVYLSINARFDKNIENHVERLIIEEDTPTGNKVVKIGLRFGKTGKTDKEADDLNKIMTLIHNLANLKDHLKTIMLNKGKDKNLIEQEINNSFHLQLIMDLSNQDKHGSPLTKTPRSGKNPQIRNINKPLMLSSNEKGQACIRMNPFWNKPVQTVHGNAVVEICADITDEQGNKLMDLDELVDKAVLAWEKVTKIFNLYNNEVK